MTFHADEPFCYFLSKLSNEWLKANFSSSLDLFLILLLVAKKNSRDNKARAPTQMLAKMQTIMMNKLEITLIKLSDYILISEFNEFN